MTDLETLNLLVQNQYVLEEDRINALKSTHDNPTLAIDYLIQNEFITYDILGQALAEYWKVPYIDLNTYIPAKQEILRIPETASRELRIIFFKELETKVQIATDNPAVLNGTARLIIKRTEKTGLIGNKKEIREERDLREELVKLFGKPIEFGYSLSQDIDKMFEAYKDPLSARFITILQKVEGVAPEMVDEIISEAIETKVSDIHFEPWDKKIVRVRFRIDGVLQEVGTLPRAYYDNILNLIKVQAQLRTDEHLIPQDGAIRFGSGDRRSDVRVSIIPTVDGEKIVLRILSNTMSNISLETIGLSEENQKIIRNAAKKPFGMVLVTGPTGSGKSTTVFSLLKIINDIGRNITTIEDPVEYRLEGVNHIQVNSTTNLSFSKGLRSILRQDPDIILVGEIRDDETAQISINAALTGHLLLSTIHSNDAESSIPRLLNMDIDAFLLASTLEIIIAQRLIRKLCSVCVYTYTASQDDLTKLANGKSLQMFFPEDQVTLYRAKGCSNCGYTGYKGRTGIFQIIELNDELRELLLTDPTADQVREMSRVYGSKSLFEDGIEKVKIGQTTLEEVMRVAAIPEI